MKKRKICVISGSRAEYGLLKPIMAEINSHCKLELLLMVAGMHLSKEFGNTVDLIKHDVFKITYRVRMDSKGKNTEEMAKSIGRGILRMTSAFKKIKPDMVLILGDRIEALAGAIVSSYLNIPVAHIHGGDVSKAGLDESARHAITKLANIHFAASEKSMERIIKMGENPDHIFLVGAPGLDSLFKEHLLSKNELSSKYGIDFENPLLILLQHSVTTQTKHTKKQIIETLKAIKALKLPTVIIYPNSDAGGRVIIEEIEKKRHLVFIKIFKNLPHRQYLSFLKYASVLIGNSSGGIIEAPSFKLPVVNIGIRQEGRERSENIIDVDHDSAAIIEAIKISLYDKKFIGQVKRCNSPYGDGHASERIVKVLSQIKINEGLLQKQIVY